ncbi:MAG: rhomboid family intramembrane serine protease [Gammaproteobacteria bacterium]|jgi:membrane associated rhomboid family serine protease
MLLPVYDRNPLRIIPFQFMTISLILVSTLLLVWEIGLSQRMFERSVLVYGMIPSVLLGPDRLDPALAPIYPPLTLLTSIFLHGGWWHLIGNMLFLWVFGDNIEDSMGHWRFLFFYLACGAAAGLVQAFATPGVQEPTIGASGAVAGVLGAYIVLHPRVKILVLAMKWLPLFVPAYFMLALWFGVQVFNGWFDIGGPVAWWAHVGGFVAGAILVVPLRDKRVPLFDRGVAH